MKKYYPAFAALLIVFAISCGQSHTPSVVFSENPEITLANSEVINNYTNGVINFALHEDSIATANLSGPRFTLTICNADSGNSFIFGDTTSAKQFIPLQDVRITKMTIFGSKMASGDTIIATLYKRAGASAPTVVAKDTLSGTEMNESVTFAANFDVSASHGFAITTKGIVTPGMKVIVLEGRYFDVR